MVRQKTLKSSIGCSGIGLHSGRKVSMTLHPADAETGIIFQRSDMAGETGAIAASWQNVVDTRMATTLGNSVGARVATVEHLMAALAGCGIDNAIVEIDGPEVPVMDGSSAPFVFLVECAGVRLQEAPRLAIKIDQTIAVGDERKYLSIRPDSAFSVSFEIDFDDSPMTQQQLSLRLVNGTFKTEIARARTFGFAHEVDALRQAGLARGGSLDNAVVINGNKVLNGDGLRYRDEFVRHKILDCVGDLYLAGAPIIGAVDALRSGHALNSNLLHILFNNPDAWSYVEMTDALVPGTSYREVSMEETGSELALA
ncbi:MAG: UDP-3-O-acyl-N-acetylglucosamine deacetylase [Rhodospirillales bacterium]|nr:UDP-3-O-acyl-N-acetylglucosamine deacetylase [Rhodospirillales bacterium]